MNTEKTYIIVPFGSGGVGKSNLIGQFVFHRFAEYCDTTIEDCYKKDITVDGERH